MTATALNHFVTQTAPVLSGATGPLSSRPGLEVVRDLSNVPARHRGAVVMIGNFDGFHLGHRALLEAARQAAAGHRIAALTPDPHPTCFFAPNATPFQLSPGQMKLRLFAEAGIDTGFLPRFDHSFASISAEDFVLETLIAAMDATHVVVGYDSRFGAGRKGDTEMLTSLMRDAGRDVTVVKPQTADGEICSSSRVRMQIEAGQMEEAARLLGTPWRVGGTAMLRQNGSKGVSARLPLGQHLRPAPGRYAVSAWLGRKKSGPVHGIATVDDRRSRIAKLTLPETEIRHLPALAWAEAEFLTKH